MYIRAKPSSWDSMSFPEVMYLWISSVREWSLSSFRQWNRRTLVSGQHVCKVSLRYLIVFTVSWGKIFLFIKNLCRRAWFDSIESPIRKRRKRSRCPFLLSKVWSAAHLSRTLISDSFASPITITFLLLFVKERCTYRAARCSWTLRWTKQKTFPWYKPNSSLKIWVHNPEYTDASVTSMPHSLRSSS